MLNIKITKTVKDVQWSFISLATASLSHLLLRIVLGRELGPSGLGVYTLVFTIYLLGMQFAGFGIGAALTKYVAEFSEKPAKTSEYILSGIIGSIATGTAMGMVLLLLSGQISIYIFKIHEMESLLRITALCFPFIALHKAALGSLNGFRRMKAFAFLEVTLNGTVLFTSIFLVLHQGLGVFGAVSGLVIPTIIVGFISAAFVWSNFITNRRLIINYSILRDVMHFGFYVVLGTSVGCIYSHIDSLMIGYYLSENDVGLYAVAAIFVQGIILIPSAVQRITNPIITENHAKRDYEFILKFIKDVTLKVTLISSVYTLFLVIYGKSLIVTIFKVDFLPAYLPLIILLIGYTIYSTFISIGTFYASIGHVKLLYKISIFSAILSIFMNVLFIPRFGIIGAATATSTSLVVLTFMHYLIIRHFVRKSWGLKQK